MTAETITGGKRVIDVDWQPAGTTSVGATEVQSCDTSDVTNAANLQNRHSGSTDTGKYKNTILDHLLNTNHDTVLYNSLTKI